MNPSYNWHFVNDKFYKKEHVYTMEWGNLDLSSFLVAGSSFGGPIALIRNPKKIVTVHSQTKRPTMFIYTSSGKLISQFVWEKGNIVGLSWAKNEILVCVVEQGTVFLFDVHGSCSDFTLGEDEILEARIFDEGLVAMTRQFQFILVSDLNEPRPKLLSFFLLKDYPACWDVLPADKSASMHPEIIIATSKTIYVLDQAGYQDQFVERGPFSEMKISPDGKYLALFTSDGHLWVVSTDFQVNVMDFDTDSKSAPIQLAW